MHADQNYSGAGAATAAFRIRQADVAAAEAALLVAAEDVARTIVSAHAPEGAHSVEIRRNPERHLVFYTFEGHIVEYDDVNASWQMEADIASVIGPEVFTSLRERRIRI